MGSGIFRRTLKIPESVEREGASMVRLWFDDFLLKDVWGA
jgi:hypothetical protein